MAQVDGPSGWRGQIANTKNLKQKKRWGIPNVFYFNGRLL